MTKAKSFDLGSIDTIAACNKPFELEIKHPATGLGTGVFISVLGRDSDVYRGRVRAMADQAMRLAAIGKPNPNDASLDKAEAKSIEALVAATVGWRTGDDPTVSVKGEKLSFTPENVARVYRELLPVREQVQGAINDVANFMPA